MTVIFPIQTHSQRSVLGVALAFSILAVTAVCLRLLAHQLARKKWTPSDWFLIAACIFSVGLQSISITGVFQAGIGYDHTQNIAALYGPEPITKLLQLIIPLQFLWVLSLSCTKISILLLYLRIFPVQWLARTAWATIVVIVAWAIATILAGCLICRPFAFNWDTTIPGGKCGNQVTSFTVTGVFNLLTDVVVLLLPMPSLYKLQMATYKKITLITVFGLGLVTCIISALRISILSTMNFADITYTIPRANIFSGIEPCLAVILASIPMMRPLLGRTTTTPDASGRTPVKSKSKSKSSSSKSSGQNGGRGINHNHNHNDHDNDNDDYGFQFRPLDDDTSQLWLRPLGPVKHSAGISVQRRRGDEDGDSLGGSFSEELLHRGYGDGRIRVQQEWAVEGGRGGS
ncbi:hypothetical protein BDW59DRAFT_178657 [Aspergillus cavernicola]|uniref:Rhodopsin domain-containing protein n=1 Tax=Aspergillus cavernicola TaxID=176166 RepID=A0ABR4HBS9_9EURO